MLLTQGRAEQIGDALDASIPEGVTEGVVELGKIIEVEGENRHPASLSGARVAQRSGEMVQKRAAIVQPRQLIVRHFPLQLFLHLGPFRSFPMELLPGPGQAFLPALNLPSEQLGLQQQSIGRETGDGGQGEHQRDSRRQSARRIPAASSGDGQRPRLAGQIQVQGNPFTGKVGGAQDGGPTRRASSGTEEGKEISGVAQLIDSAGGHHLQQIHDHGVRFDGALVRAALPGKHVLHQGHLAAA